MKPPFVAPPDSGVLFVRAPRDSGDLMSDIVPRQREFWRGARWGLFLGGMAIAIQAGAIMAFGDNPKKVAARWRAWECAKGGAVSLDTLCVRTDSSWRVEEPPQ